MYQIWRHVSTVSQSVQMIPKVNRWGIVYRKHASNAGASQQGKAKLRMSHILAWLMICTIGVYRSVNAANNNKSKSQIVKEKKKG